jgi:hypothetical protein
VSSQATVPNHTREVQATSLTGGESVHSALQRRPCRAIGFSPYSHPLTMNITFTNNRSVLNGKMGSHINYVNLVGRNPSIAGT